MRGNVNNLSVEMFVCLFVCLFVFVQDKGDMIINECGSQNKQTTTTTTHFKAAMYIESKCLLWYSTMEQRMRKLV